MTPLLVPIVSMLAEKGLNLLSDAIDKGSDKAIEYVSEKTGIDLTNKPELSTEDIRVLKELEMSNKIELERLAFENKKEDNRTKEVLYTTAHDTYREKSETADLIANQIIMYNLPVIFLLLVMNVALLHFLKDDSTLIAIASNVIGVAIGMLFNERSTIINFFFGSSIGSKEKDKK